MSSSLLLSQGSFFLVGAGFGAGFALGFSAAGAFLGWAGFLAAGCFSTDEKLLLNDFSGEECVDDSRRLSKS